MSAEDDGTKDAHARSEMECARRAALMVGCCPECWEHLVKKVEEKAPRAARVGDTPPVAGLSPRARFMWYCPACAWEEELAHGQG